MSKKRKPNSYNPARLPKPTLETLQPGETVTISRPVTEQQLAAMGISVEPIQPTGAPEPQEGVDYVINEDGTRTWGVAGTVAVESGVNQ